MEPEPTVLVSPSGVASCCSLDPIVSVRSMPVQNARSPAPVSTATRTSSSWRMPRQTSRSSFCMATLKALCTSGRLSVTQATPSRTSYRSVS